MIENCVSRSRSNTAGRFFNNWIGSDTPKYGATIFSWLITNGVDPPPAKIVREPRALLARMGAASNVANPRFHTGARLRLRLNNFAGYGWLAMVSSVAPDRCT